MTNKYLFANLWLFGSKEGDKTTPPSFAIVNMAIHAPIALLKALMATRYIRGNGNGSTLQTTNNYLFSNLFSFMSGEVYRASSPPFLNANAMISASSASLEAPIASLLSIGSTLKEATFLREIKLLIVVGLLFACANDEWTTTPSCTSISAYNALL